jgi:hypothetical protein
MGGAAWSRGLTLPLIYVGFGLDRGRAVAQVDHNATIDDNAIGTGSAGGSAYLGEGSPALPSRHWRIDQLVIILAGL